MEQRLKGFKEFLIRDLCRPEPAEVYCRPHVVSRGIPGAGPFVNCVGLTPHVFTPAAINPESSQTETRDPALGQISTGVWVIFIPALTL